MKPTYEPVTDLHPKSPVERGTARVVMGSLGRGAAPLWTRMECACGRRADVQPSRVVQPYRCRFCARAARK